MSIDIDILLHVCHIYIYNIPICVDPIRGIRMGCWIPAPQTCAARVNLDIIYIWQIIYLNLTYRYAEIRFVEFVRNVEAHAYAICIYYIRTHIYNIHRKEYIYNVPRCVGTTRWIRKECWSPRIVHIHIYIYYILYMYIYTYVICIT